MPKYKRCGQEIENKKTERIVLPPEDKNLTCYLEGDGSIIKLLKKLFVK